MTQTPLDGAHAYIWVYHVKAGMRAAFADAYGPKGEWVKFFANSPDYIRTEFMADEIDENKFVTIDYFRSEKARSDLVEARPAEFEKIDSRWERATEEETFIGAFRVSSNA